MRKDLSLDWRVHLNDSYYWPEDKDEAIITIKPGEKTPVKLLLFSLDSKATTDSVKVANFMKITTQAPAVKVDEIKWELSKIDGSGYKGIPYGTVTLKNLLIPVTRRFNARPSGARVREKTLVTMMDPVKEKAPVQEKIPNWRRLSTRGSLRTSNGVCLWRPHCESSVQAILPLVKV